MLDSSLPPLLPSPALATALANIADYAPKSSPERFAVIAVHSPSSNGPYEFRKGIIPLHGSPNTLDLTPIGQHTLNMLSHDCSSIGVVIIAPEAPLFLPIPPRPVNFSQRLPTSKA